MGTQMFSKWRVDLDPLDLEILERALEGALTTMKEKDYLMTSKAMRNLNQLPMRRAYRNCPLSGLTDAEALRDAAFALAKEVTEKDRTLRVSLPGSPKFKIAATIGVATD